MAETKYGKYFFSGVRPTDLSLGQSPPAGSAPPDLHMPSGTTPIAYLDDNVIKGCHFYRITRETQPGLHGPHIHKYAELLIHLGTNPDDPFDLGAEIEICMGKEMEKHIITKSTVVYIPPYFIHCPWTIKRVDRPWIFIQINQGPVPTEKSYPQILSEEEREKYHFGKDHGF